MIPHAAPAPSPGTPPAAGSLHGRSRGRAAAVLRPVAAVLAGGLAMAAGAATQTHVTSFVAAGGDASFGYGATHDPTYNLNVYKILPLFDPALGTLERVSFTLQGWRSLASVCSVANHPDAAGACTARIDGAFHLEAANPAVSSQIAPMAHIRPVIESFTSVWPPVGGSLPLNLWAEDSAAGEITSPALLASFFTAGGHPDQGITLRFVPQDSGYFGYGGGAGFSAMLWDADASVSVTYHYAAAVPEPSAAWLLAGGLGGLGGVLWRRRRTAA